MKNLSFRSRAFIWHLVGSSVAAFAAWLLATQVWYPSPMDTLAGGMQLFLIVIGVDMVLGPCLTAVIANPTKPRRELVRDVAIVLALQVSALAYGINTLAAARPAVLAFEVDLFRLVAAIDIQTEQLQSAPPQLRDIGWTGPRTLAAVKPTNSDEIYDSIQLGLAGIHLAALPRYWRNYDEHAGQAWDRASPIAKVLNQQPNLKQEIDKIASSAQVHPASLRVLPLLARRAEGMVLLAPGGRVAGMLAATAPQ